MDIPDVDQTNLECHLWGGDGSLDRDFYELKKLRLEARMNITENNICEDYSDSLLSSDYVDSIKIVLVIDQTRVNELIKNDPLMDSIKSDVKELVNKRLEEFYSFTDDNFEQDNILHKKVVIIIISSSLTEIMNFLFFSRIYTKTKKRVKIPFVMIIRQINMVL